MESLLLLLLPGREATPLRNEEGAACDHREPIAARSAQARAPVRNQQRVQTSSSSSDHRLNEGAGIRFIFRYSSGC